MTVFERWGRFVHRHRLAVLPVSLALVVASLWALTIPHQFVDQDSETTQASQADALVTAELPGMRMSTDILFVFSSRTLTAGDPAFREAVQAALAPLAGRFHVAQVVTPYTSSSDAARLVSADRHSAVADVTVSASTDDATAEYPALRATVSSPVLTIRATGAVPLSYDYNRLQDQGLASAEGVALPVSLLLLVLVFGTLVAAALPLLVGVLTIGGAFGAAVLISQATPVSASISDFVSLLGLGLAIDYSLFVVSRFREALADGLDTQDALGLAMATAGRSIVFSGLTVMTGLSGLFLFQGTWLGELAAPLICLVAMALIYGTTLLPACLSLLGRRVNAWRLPLPRRRRAGGFWHALATRVMRRPVMILVPTLAAVAVAASPVAGLSLATDHGDSLPATAQSRQASDAITASFPQLDQAQIPVVVDFPNGSTLTPAHVAEIHDLTQAISRIPGVVGVSSVFNLPGLDRAATVRLLSASPSAWPAAVASGVAQSVGRDIALLHVETNQREQTDGARTVVTRIRGLSEQVGGQLMVTGATAYDMDRTAWILSRAPLAIGLVVTVTFLLLTLLLGSVVLPLKAVFTNLLSLSVSYGVMVWIFQQGHLAALIGFTPLPIDPTVPVAMFCVLFGLSMDYEVLLLTRIQEEYARTGSTRLAVAQGLERCGRLITYAALIMTGVFASFTLAGVTTIKMVGVGTAVAVLVDATVMRALVVPALMVLMGRLNWWMPRWLARVVGRTGLGEARVATTRTQSSGAVA
ncbi:MAG TPA: MMPL family transporter [Candidatus Binatia bacterium]|nr:MMPL family transporter [Candidatus Binatia bacterium]